MQVEQAAGTRWTRRDFSRAIALLALAAGIPVAGVVLSELDPTEAPSERQLALMREVAQGVIPATDTPGAGDVGAGAFTVLALAHGLDGTRQPFLPSPLVEARHLRPDGSLNHVSWLENVLDRRAGGDWLSLTEAARNGVLGALDAEAYAEGAGEHPWRAIKGLILTGYYTSREGGAVELVYDPLPGTFQPRVPVTPQTRAISNDWTAVEFG
jgi:hypothetical protein